MQHLFLLLSLIDAGARWRQSESMNINNRNKRTYTQVHSYVKRA